MLSINGLTHIYPNGVQALDNVTLDIPKGMFGLLGPNGAGKSSLMRTIATLQQATSGSIHFGDIDVKENPDQIRRVLGYLPQDFGVYPRGSAYELLDHLAVLKGLTNAKKRKAVVEGLLVQTNLFEVRNKKLATFSGGMRQRFGIAQALIGDPQLIIVDEPTAGLDPEERNRFHNLLSEIGENVVVILSTHIVEDVSDLCPQMAIIAEGKIISHGTPADLTADLDGKIWQKVVGKEEVDLYKENYMVISTKLTAGRTVISVYGNEDPGEGFTAMAPTLEDVYFTAIAMTRAETENATTVAAE